MKNEKPDDRLDRLFTAARRLRPDTSRLEEDFDKRLMAGIRERQSPASVWLAWQRRLAPAFILLVAILATVTLLFEARRSQDLISFLINGGDTSTIVTDLRGGNEHEEY